MAGWIRVLILASSTQCAAAGLLPRLPTAARSYPAVLRLRGGSAATSALGSLLPIGTRVATAAGFAAAGDIIAQRSAAQALTWDRTRTLSLVLTDSFYKGLLLHPLIQFAYANLHGQLLGTAVLERTLYGTLFVAPFIYYPIFFATTGVVQGLSRQQVLQRAWRELPRVFGWNMCYWIPVQLVQYAFVPMAWKISFLCSMGFMWTIALSRLAGSATTWCKAMSGCEVPDASDAVLELVAT